MNDIGVAVGVHYVGVKLSNIHNLFYWSIVNTRTTKIITRDAITKTRAKDLLARWALKCGKVGPQAHTSVILEVGCMYMQSVRMSVNWSEQRGQSTGTAGRPQVRIRLIAAFVAAF